MLQVILHNLFSFILIISIIVFIHEFGHFIVARLFKVKVEEFSIGFGFKLFGFKDRYGTLWKFCLFPFGGYVKMYGDRNAASMTDEEALKKMTKKEQEISFIGKNVWQRMAIVAAGPAANFVLAIVLFAVLFRINGVAETRPIISKVIEDTPAARAGLLADDEIVAINDKNINSFDQIVSAVSLNTGQEMEFSVRRKAEIFDIKITPEFQIRKDFAGEEVKIPMIGVQAQPTKIRRLNIFQSLYHGTTHTYDISTSILKTLGQLIVGQRSVKELGGPVKIAKYSGKTVESGLKMVIWFMALISVNLGVINLLPIPVLDGGHLFYYFIEAFRGRALSPKTQKIGFQLGFSLIITLMLFTTVNDIVTIIN